MTEEKRNLPFPDDLEIDRQASLIVQKAFPAKRYFLKEMRDFKNQMGWLYLLPNRGETIFTSLLLILTIFCLGLIASVENSMSPFFYGSTFLTAPMSLFLLTAYAIYEKWEKQTFELEMTMKITIFQVIAVRILVFSGISLFINMTAAFVMAVNFEVEFLRIWLISLTGLFAFASGLLWFVSRGNIWRRTAMYTTGWLVINSGWLFMMKDAYLQFVIHLPLVVYTGILVILMGFFFYTFKKAFTRKQEGLWTC